MLPSFGDALHKAPGAATRYQGGFPIAFALKLFAKTFLIGLTKKPSYQSVAVSGAHFFCF